MLCENDRIKFFKAMEVEIHDHKDCCHWTLMLRKDLPDDKPIGPAAQKSVQGHLLYHL
jgi:hypothetical protein